MRLVIIGAGGHGKVVADIAEKIGYTEIVFLDDAHKGGTCGKHPVVGACDDAIQYKNADFFVAIGNVSIRKKIQMRLEQDGLRIVSLIHPNAVVAETAKIGVGTVVMAGAVINPEATIGSGCIINTCSSVDHDCRIGDYVHVAVGAHLCGTVLVGECTWIGAGATVINNVSVCSECLVAAGAVVVKNICVPGKYMGVPAVQKTLYNE